MNGHSDSHSYPRNIYRDFCRSLRSVIHHVIMGWKKPELSELCRDNSKHFAPRTHVLVDSS